MTVTEKVAFLKGLMEGLDLSADTKENKILKLMADILEDLANDLTDVNDTVEDLSEYVEALDEDLTNVEDELFGDDDDCDCCDCDDDDCDCCDCDDDCDCYEVDCPECNNTIVLEEAPEGDSIVCPSCKKEIKLK